MAKIPFDIKYRPQIESGEYKVIYLDLTMVEESPARIICWDRHNEYSIVALVSNSGGYERVQMFQKDGTDNPHLGKLFIVTPEEEMTEWQRFISACLQKHGLLDCGAADRIAKESAAELLKIAEKQINSDGYLILHRCSFEDEIYHREKRASEKAEAEAKLRWYDKGVEDGKAEVLKVLPRWKKASGKERFNERMIVLMGDNDLFCTNYVEEGEYYIPFSGLEKLPKEDESHE